MSLQRVPPNLLVGSGATDFAYEHGIPVLPHDFLVSAAARERWIRWKHDIDMTTASKQDQTNSFFGRGFQGTQPWGAIDVDAQVPTVLIGPPSPRASRSPTLDPRLHRVSSTGAETIVRVPTPKHHNPGNGDRGRYFVSDITP